MLFCLQNQSVVSQQQQQQQNVFLTPAMAATACIVEMANDESLQHLFAWQKQQQQLDLSSISSAAFDRPAVVYRDPTKAPLRRLSIDLIHTYKHINEVSCHRVQFLARCTYP